MPSWENSIRIYGDYLKNIMQYVQPYGMVPSGVYQKDEVKDSVNFYIVQVGIDGGCIQRTLKNSLRME